LPNPTSLKPSQSEPRSYLLHENQLPTSQSDADASLPKPFAKTHSITTHDKAGIFKPKKLFSVTKYPLPPSTKPTCVTHDLQHSEWKQAMTDEFIALVNNGTWSTT